MRPHDVLLLRLQGGGGSSLFQIRSPFHFSKLLMLYVCEMDLCLCVCLCSCVCLSVHLSNCLWS